jgi:creatinine amidohydrolase/Fe(II)-dependent formamide hydrolase-like protein
MVTARGVRLDDLTLSEAEARLATDPVVVLPVFAAAPAAPHLPLKTGETIARALGQRIAERLPVIVHRETPERDLAAAVAYVRALGAHRLAALDTGFSRTARIEMPPGAFSLHVGADPSVADDVETSLMYALDPRSIRAELLPSSSGASAFDGERALTACVDRAVAALCVRWPDLVA